ncbi:OLC1v1019249C1 [Oldenlandia corymbosa var. corymbosa]|uniref:OLC1v1019249C1 n=1 Tax=Oldenlandia corymbosa var. corymbosa TaxID=529605 RepID=A0AAV1EDY9_OLDCO|nr:OLC1v1019249C1 [Oldenlandia corymbosa var. corymbosa]
MQVVDKPSHPVTVIKPLEAQSKNRPAVVQPLTDSIVADAVFGKQVTATAAPKIEVQRESLETQRVRPILDTSTAGKISAQRVDIVAAAVVPTNAGSLVATPAAVATEALVATLDATENGAVNQRYDADPRNAATETRQLLIPLTSSRGQIPPPGDKENRRESMVETPSFAQPPSTQLISEDSASFRSQHPLIQYLQFQKMIR